jgi:hypothetical protein
MEEKMYVYVVIEEYNNDGEIEVHSLGVFSTMEKAQSRMDDRLEQYKSYGVFEESDFELMERDYDSIYIYAESDDYYGKIDIIKEEVK